MKHRFLFLLPLTSLIILCAGWLAASPVEAASILPLPNTNQGSACIPQLQLYVPLGLMDKTTEIRPNDCAVTALLIGQAVSHFAVASYYHPFFGFALPKLLPLTEEDKQAVREAVIMHRAQFLSDPCGGTGSKLTVDAGFGNDAAISLGNSETLKEILSQAQYHPGSCTQ